MVAVHDESPPGWKVPVKRAKPETLEPETLEMEGGGGIGKLVDGTRGLLRIPDRPDHQERVVHPTNPRQPVLEPSLVVVGPANLEPSPVIVQRRRRNVENFYIGGELDLVPPH